MEKDQFRILVVGCGSIGQRHARLLSRRKDVTLFIADPVLQNREACKAAANVQKEYADYTAALSEGMDGVFVCVPDKLHVSVALNALNAGACILCEKPVAPGVAEAEKLLAAERRVGRKVQIGYMSRFNSQLQFIKRMIDAGEFGNVAHISTTVDSYVPLLFAKGNHRDTQKWVIAGDYSHDIDMVQYLLGSIQTVAAFSGRLGALEHMPDPNVVQIMFRFQNGVIGGIGMDYIRLPGRRSMEIVGDKASAEFYFNDGEIRLSRRGSEYVEEYKIPFVRDDMFAAQIENFIGMIKGGNAPMTSLEEGIRDLKVSEAIVRSCVEGRFIDIEA